MPDTGELKAEVIADARAATRVSAEEWAIAALVMTPFTLAAVLLLGWMMPLPSLVAQILWLAASVVATAWNAGWRARTSA